MAYKPSWDNAPEWANYLAKDFDGIWYWFQHKPEYDGADGTWYADGGECESVDIDDIHAHNTLESRPVPNEVSYKERCDEVLLSRGKSGGTHIDAKGKTVEQVFDMLMTLPSQQRSERPIEEYLGIKCHAMVCDEFDDWGEYDSVCARCCFGDLGRNCDKVPCVSFERPDNTSVFFLEVK